MGRRGGKKRAGRTGAAGLARPSGDAERTAGDSEGDGGAALAVEHGALAAGRRVVHDQGEGLSAGGATLRCVAGG